MNAAPEPTIGLIVQHVKRPGDEREVSFKVIEIHRSSIEGKNGLKTFIDKIKVLCLNVDGSEIEQMYPWEFTLQFWNNQFSNNKFKLK